MGGRDEALIGGRGGGGAQMGEAGDVTDKGSRLWEEGRSH